MQQSLEFYEVLALRTETFSSTFGFVDLWTPPSDRDVLLHSFGVYFVNETSLNYALYDYDGVTRVAFGSGSSPIYSGSPRVFGPLVWRRKYTIGLFYTSLADDNIGTIILTGRILPKDWRAFYDFPEPDYG